MTRNNWHYHHCLVDAFARVAHEDDRFEDLPFSRCRCGGKAALAHAPTISCVLSIRHVGGCTVGLQITALVMTYVPEWFADYGSPAKTY